MPEIKIAGKMFTVPEPYAEGHTLAANEASALNGLLAENLRNNFASKVKAETEAAAAEGRDFNQSGLQAQLDAYSAEYSFGVRRSGGGGGGGLPTDPIERESVKIARDMVRSALRAQGKKAEPEAINNLANQLIQVQPDIRKEAERRVKAQQKIASVELDLSSLAVPQGE